MTGWVMIMNEGIGQNMNKVMNKVIGYNMTGWVMNKVIGYDMTGWVMNKVIGYNMTGWVIMTELDIA